MSTVSFNDIFVDLQYNDNQLTMVRDMVHTIVDISKFGTSQELMDVYADFNQIIEKNVKTILFNVEERAMILQIVNDLFCKTNTEKEYISALSFGDVSFHLLIQDASIFKTSPKNHLKLFLGILCTSSDMFEWSEWSNDAMCVNILNSPEHVIILVEAVTLKSPTINSVDATWLTITDTMDNLQKTCHFLIVCRNQENYDAMMDSKKLPKGLSDSFLIHYKHVTLFETKHGGGVFILSISKKSLPVNNRSTVSYLKSVLAIPTSPVVTDSSSYSDSFSQNETKPKSLQTYGRHSSNAPVSLQQSYTSKNSLHQFVSNSNEYEMLVTGTLDEFGIPEKSDILAKLQDQDTVILSCTLNLKSVIQDRKCREGIIKRLLFRKNQKGNQFPVALTTDDDLDDDVYLLRCYQDMNRYWLEVLIAVQYVVKGRNKDGMIEMRDRENNIVATYDKNNNNRNAHVNQFLLLKLIERFIDVSGEESYDELTNRLKIIDEVDQKTFGYNVEFKSLMVALVYFVKNKLEENTSIHCDIMFHAPYNTLNEERKKTSNRLPFTGYLSPTLSDIIVSYDVYNFDGIK